jgi:hypothetical protein
MLHVLSMVLEALSPVIAALALFGFALFFASAGEPNER